MRDTTNFIEKMPDTTGDIWQLQNIKSLQSAQEAKDFPDQSKKVARK
jgi:hypothetical protein